MLAVDKWSSEKGLSDLFFDQVVGGLWPYGFGFACSPNSPNGRL